MNSNNNSNSFSLLQVPAMSSTGEIETGQYIDIGHHTYDTHAAVIVDVSHIWGMRVSLNDRMDAFRVIATYPQEKFVEKIPESPVFVSSILMDGEYYDLEESDME